MKSLSREIGRQHTHVPKNYRRGLTRVYLLLSVGWLIWSIYKPLHDREKSITYFYALEPIH